jgi:O-antigen/teichoic acid export membrane protein
MIARLKHLADAYRASIRAYLSMIGGSAGRLVISLVYFIAIANTLSISEFGLFATASACGIMLSRLMAFGFVSPLYRIATVKTRLLGVYTAGFLGGLGLSMPVIALAAWATHWLVFRRSDGAVRHSQKSSWPKCCAGGSWRSLSSSATGSTGLGRVPRWWWRRPPSRPSPRWPSPGWPTDRFRPGPGTMWRKWIGGAAGGVFFYPRVRLRWKPALYIRRWVDAVSVAGAEMLFYVQSELDKVLVLSLGGPEAAGIYAMIMRLVDLTALPVRAFLTILTQRLMRTSKMLDAFWNRVKLESAVAAVSTAGLLGMAGFLWIFPNALGKNVAEAAPLLILVAMVPAFRNLIEYHSELLYATGRTVIRMLVLSSLGAMKALLLAYVLGLGADVAVWVQLMNVLFFVLYVQSALFTYQALRRIKKRPI